MKKIKDRYTNNIFENIKYIDKYGTNRGEGTKSITRCEAVI